MTKNNSLNFYSIFKWVIIISFVVYAVFPFLWLVLASLKTNAELLDNPFKLPKVFQFQNYSNAIKEANKQGAFVFWNHPHWEANRSDGIAKLDPIHKEIINKGYDVFMIMIYTHPMISFISNFSRERRIPKVGVFSTWKTVYNLIETYKNMLGDNFTLFINNRGDKFKKEVDDFNNAASKGAKGIYDYLNSYMEDTGGREAYKSTFNKPFKLDDKLENEFRKLAANTSADLEDEGTYKALAKDYQKFHHHYESGKYGADRIQSNYNKYLDKQEKDKQRHLGDLESIANTLYDDTFHELLKHSSVEEIDKKVQRFLT